MSFLILLDESVATQCSPDFFRRQVPRPHHKFSLLFIREDLLCKVLHLSTFKTMAPSATSDHSTSTSAEDTTIISLRKTLTSESVPLARRFRALFSLKHLACLQPPTSQTLPAIQAIAAAFTSPSALLKHELAYCLGQTRNLDCVPYLRKVLQDRDEDTMCRHEAAEALGALGDMESLGLLRNLRDDTAEEDVVRETCDIAVERIEWENSEERAKEKLKKRFDTACG